jgi:hypothetical protein
LVEKKGRETKLFEGSREEVNEKRRGRKKRREKGEGKKWGSRD